MVSTRAEAVRQEVNEKIRKRAAEREDLKTDEGLTEEQALKKLREERHAEKNTFPFRAIHIGTTKDELKYPGEKLDIWASVNRNGTMERRRRLPGAKVATQYVKFDSVKEELNAVIEKQREILMERRDQVEALKQMDCNPDPDRSLSKIEIDLAFKFKECFEAAIGMARSANFVKSGPELAVEVVDSHHRGKDIYTTLRDALPPEQILDCKEAVAVGVAYIHRHGDKFPPWFKRATGKEKWSFCETFLVDFHYNTIIGDAQFAVLDSLDLEAIRSGAILPLDERRYRAAADRGPFAIKSPQNFKDLGNCSLVAREVLRAAGTSASAADNPPPRFGVANPKPYFLPEANQHLVEGEHHQEWVNIFFPANDKCPTWVKTSVPTAAFVPPDDADRTHVKTVTARLFKAIRQLKPHAHNKLVVMVYYQYIIPAAVEACRNGDLSTIDGYVSQLMTMAVNKQRP